MTTSRALAILQPALAVVGAKHRQRHDLLLQRLTGGERHAGRRSGG